MENDKDNGSSSNENADESSTSHTESYEPNIKQSKMDNNDAGSPQPSTSGAGGPSRSRSTSNDLEASHSYDEAVRKRQHVRRTHRNYRDRATSSASTGDEDGDGDGNGEGQRAADQLANKVDDNIENVAEDNSENANAGRVEERLPTVNEESASSHGSWQTNTSSSSSTDTTSNNDEDMQIDTDSDASEVSQETLTRINTVMNKAPPRNNICLVRDLLYRQHGLSVGHSSTAITTTATNDPTSIPFRNRTYGSLFSVERLELLHKLDAHDGCVNSLHFNRSGNLLVSGSDDLKLIVWKWATNKAQLKFETGHRANIFQTKFVEFAYNTSGLNIATSSRDGDVRLIEISPDGGPTSRVLFSHKKPVHKIALANMCPYELLTAGEDGSVMCYDLRDNNLATLVNLRANNRKVTLYSIAAHPFDPQFCVCGVDKQVRVYDKRNGKEPLKLFYPNTLAGQKTRDFHVTSALYNHDGTEILASYAADKIYLFDNTVNGTNEYLHSYMGHRNVTTIKGVNFFGPSSEYVISGSDCGNVFIWDRKTESIVQWMAADQEGVVNCLEGHPSFPILATSGLDSDVKIWMPTKTDGTQISIDALRKCVQRNMVSSENDCISELNSSLLEYLMRTLSNRRRINPERTESASGPNSSDSSLDDMDDDDDDDDDYALDQPFGAQSCTTS